MSAKIVQSGSSKCAVACDHCRAKKIKCDAKQPCKNCINHGRTGLCVYPPSNARPPRRNAKERQKVLQSRLGRAESLLQAAGLYAELEMQENMDQIEARGREAYGLTLTSSFSNFTQDDQQNRRGGEAHATSAINVHASRIEFSEGIGHNSTQKLPLLTPCTSLSTAHTYSEQYGLSETSQDRNITEGIDLPSSIFHQRQNASIDSVFSLSDSYTLKTISKYPMTLSSDPTAFAIKQLQSPAETEPSREENQNNTEVHGLGSFLSICSQAGGQWVSEKLGTAKFATSAILLSSFVAQSLKLQQSSKIVQTPEPDFDTAWKYTQAFFDEGPEASTNVIHRPIFEARLRVHLETDKHPREEASWFALRNVVYAFGSRILVYRDNGANSWIEAQLQGWRYFQNAFSMHTDLVYFWSSIEAVQALFAMALYVEGIGAPKLEYMLVSNALRLAQAKGLGSQSSTPGTISEPEVQNRSWLFWSIYVFEKHISFRSRRPSAIEDNTIDCPIPTQSPDGNSHKAELFRHIIYHAQISSAVMSELILPKSRHRAPSLIAEKIQDLEQRLEQWRANLPDYLKPVNPLKASNLLPGISLEHKMWIHFSYYGTLSAIHSIFACPWNFSDIEDEEDRTVRQQINLSVLTQADAARNIILATRSVTIDAAAPTWLTFLHPFMAMLNLFTYILRFPSLPSVETDIHLLDMVAGYFGYLSFSTLSHVTVSFAKEVTQWARAAVEKSRQNEKLQEQIPAALASASPALIADLQPIYDFGDMGGFEFEFDDWKSYFSTL